MKITLVLGGGGARGLAHVGVLKALEKTDVEIERIIGCSFGAIVGGMYAQNPDAAAVEDRLYSFFNSAQFDSLGLHLLRKKSVMTEDYFQQLSQSVKDWLMMNVVARRSSLLKSERLQEAVRFLINEGDIQDTQIPFFCNATDLVSGDPYLFQEGDIQTAITASSTIPGYFPPVIMEDKKLVDGAVTSTLPTRFARTFNAGFVVAVDVRPELHPEEDYSNVLEVILRAGAITAQSRAEEQIYSPDVLVSPAIKEYYWYEFDRFREMINAGEEAMVREIHRIPRQRIPRTRTLQRFLGIST